MQINVVVIDEDIVRGESLARACSSCKTFEVISHVIPKEEFAHIKRELRNNPEVQSILIHPSKLRQIMIDRTVNPASELASINVAFIHYRNERIKLTINSDLTIWYGGSGYKKERGKKWGIHRTISNKNDVELHCNKPALEELFNWAIKGASEVPSLLKPVSSVQYLSALTILCQGYLIIHAQYEGENKDWENLDIEYALKQMGWQNRAKSISGFLPKVDESRKDEVRDAGWWTRILIGNWEEEFKMEWDEALHSSIPPAIKRLIKGIKVGKDIPLPKDIADAYCELVRRLGGKPCSPIK